MIVAGAAGLALSLPIAIAILFAIITLSYRQTVMSYLHGLPPESREVRRNRNTA